MRRTVLGAALILASLAPGAAEVPPAPIPVTTTASVAAPDAAALPPPRQAALETVGMTPAQETRYRALTKELRCPLCQNQAIADSDAPISADLRDQVRSRILAGASDDAIRGYVTDRFGDFALYRPRFGGATLWLWLAPLALLLVGGGLVFMRFKARGAGAAAVTQAGPVVDRPVPAATLKTPSDDAPGETDAQTRARLSRLLAEEGVAPPPAPPSPLQIPAA